MLVVANTFQVNAIIYAGPIDLFKVSLKVQLEMKYFNGLLIISSSFLIRLQILKLLLRPQRFSLTSCDVYTGKVTNTTFLIVSVDGTILVFPDSFLAPSEWTFHKNDVAHCHSAMHWPRCLGLR